MSRSGYSDDIDSSWRHISWRGAVASAIRGARGQAFLKEMLAALDALPEKRLIAGDLAVEPTPLFWRWGEPLQVCAIGSVGKARGLDMSQIDPEDPSQVARAFGIAEALAQEIEFENDQDFSWKNESPERRFARMRAWVVSCISGSPDRSEDKEA